MPELSGGTSPQGSKGFVRTVLLGMLAAAFVYAVWRLGRVLLFLFAAVLIALFLRGLAEGLARRLRLPAPVALAAVGLGLLALFVGGVWGLGPRIASEFADLFRKLPAALSDLRSTIAEVPWLRELLDEFPNAGAIAGQAGEVTSRVFGVFSSTIGTVTTGVLVILIGVYFAAQPNTYFDLLVRLLPLPRRPRAVTVISAITRALRRWLVGRVASMTAIGGLSGIGLAVAGVPLALSLGILAGLLSFIPFLGPLLSALPMVLIGLNAGGLELAGWAGLIYLGVQALESWLITPLIERVAVSMPPAFVLLAQIVMGILAGLLGILLATPLAVMAAVLVELLYVEDVLGERAVGGVAGQEEFGPSGG